MESGCGAGAMGSESGELVSSCISAAESLWTLSWLSVFLTGPLAPLLRVECTCSERSSVLWSLSARTGPDSAADCERPRPGLSTLLEPLAGVAGPWAWSCEPPLTPLMPFMVVGPPRLKGSKDGPCWGLMGSAEGAITALARPFWAS